MDYRELLSQIPDSSVDLILCDPVWWEAEQYANVAREGKRVLKPGGLCVAQVGSLYLYQAMVAMGQHLDWYWEISETLANGRAFFARRMTQFHKPHIIFANGIVNCPKRRFLPDRLQSEKTKAKHSWQDGEGVYYMLVETLTSPGDTVVDPFACSGTVPVVCKRLGRDFYAGDIDGELVVYANQRLAETQVNMIVPTFIQKDIYQMLQEVAA